MRQTDHPIVAPADSMSFRKLIQYAGNAGVDTDMLRDILWLIVAHSQLVALPLAASRLLRIMSHAPAIWAPALEETGVVHWRATLEWIVREQDALAKELGEHFARKTNTTGNNPVMGSGATWFPVYACLCEPLPPAAHGDSYILLLGHLILGHVAAMRDASTRNDYEVSGLAKDWHFLENQANSAALSVRRYAESEYQPYLEELPVALSPHEFAEALEELDETDSETLNDDRVHLYRFLQKCWGLIEWVERGGGGGQGTGGHKWVGGRQAPGSRVTIERMQAGDQDDPSTNEGTVSIVKTRPSSPRTKKARLNSDLPPEEAEDDEDIILSDFDCETTKPDYGALARAARAKSRHIAKANQLVPWDYAGLAAEELARLLGVMTANFKTIPGPQHCIDTDYQEIETLLLIHTMIWTGSDFVRASCARLCETERDDGDIALGLVVPMTGKIDHILWRIQALEPEYRTNLDGQPGQLRSRQASLDLPDLIGITPFVKRHLERRTRIEHGSALFQATPEILETRVMNWLKRYSPDGRITIAKLAGTLWSNIYQDWGDPAFASCITGELHPLARVRLFYTTPSIRLLREGYVSAVSTLADQAYAILGKPSHLAHSVLQEPETDGLAAVGARLCPTTKAVRGLFTRLVEDVAEASQYTDRAGFIRYHNLLTLHTVQFFAYATSCRAIVTPYLSPDRIHWSRGLASLSDKDDTSRHKSRLVWLPEKLLDQMARYANHLDTLKAQLTTRSAMHLNEPCLFLDQDFKPLWVRPKTIEPWLTGYLDVRANTHRRYLRTELIERRCPPEVVDAFLGHWQQGEEPFGPYSSFSFAEYVETLRDYLEPLLTEIGLDRPLGLRWDR
jgi:hypothetical protein